LSWLHDDKSGGGGGGGGDDDDDVNFLMFSATLRPIFLKNPCDSFKI